MMPDSSPCHSSHPTLHAPTCVPDSPSSPIPPGLFFQYYGSVCVIHPVDRPYPASEHHGAIPEHHVPALPVRRPGPATVPQHLPGARDEGVRLGGGPVCQAAFLLPLARDCHQVDTQAKQER